MLARPGLPVFDYVRPASAEEASGLLLAHGAAVKLMAGGTDLLPRLRDGLLHPDLVVDLKAIPGMRDLAYDPEDGLTVGAAVALNALAGHCDVVERYPLLAESANSVASYQVRTRATLGGNLCNASPAADTAPAALCLDARALLYGPQGTRQVKTCDFFVAPGRTAIEPAELLVAVRFPVPPPGGCGRYLKLGRNKAGDLAIVGVAVFGWRDEASRSGYRFRLGLASVGPVPMRAGAAEEELERDSPTPRRLMMAAEAAAESASPVDDIRASAAYRKEMVKNLALRGLQDVVARLMRGQPGQDTALGLEVA